jgi:hypothetical protein
MSRGMAAAAALSLFVGLLSPAPAAARQDERTWLALGDSYSSGEGIKTTPATYSPTLGRDCRRATGEGTPAVAWAVEAQRQVGADLRLRKPDFVACTGAIADEAPWQIQEARSREGSPDRWDLVTFSFGGNNIKFSDVITGCLGASTKSWKNFANGCLQDEDQLRRRVDMLAGRQRIDTDEYAGGITVPTLLDLVARNVAPGGDVVVLGYPNLIEDPSRWSRFNKGIGRCSGVFGKDVPMLRRVGGYLNQTLAGAVEDANGRHQDERITFHFLNIAENPYESSNKGGDRHARCTDDPWLNGVTLNNNEGDWKYKDRSFHPNEKGHHATGRVLADYLKEHVRFDDTDEPTEPDRIDDAFLGSWRSPDPADQPTSDKTYYVEITLRNGAVGEKVGEIGYPGLDCTGSLTLVGVLPDRIVLTELIEAQPRFPCFVQGEVTLVRTGDGLDFSYERNTEPGVVTVTAKMVRA